MDDKTLLAHMEDLATRAQKTGMAHSKFLTASQAAEVATAYKNRRDVTLLLAGGFEGAERQVAIFLQPDWGSCQEDEVLAGLALRHRAEDEIRHRDVLGAALGLGLSREVLGDIFIAPGQACLVCLAPMAGFITEGLTKVGRVGVKPARVPLAELPDLSAQLCEKQVTLASLRLDAVLAAAFGLSRAVAAEAILAGKVQLAHRECQNPAAPVGEGAVVSLRGAGRVKLLAAQGATRKGRLRVLLGVY